MSVVLVPTEREPQRGYDRCLPHFPDRGKDAGSVVAHEAVRMRKSTLLRMRINLPQRIFTAIGRNRFSRAAPENRENQREEYSKNALVGSLRSCTR